MGNLLDQAVNLKDVASVKRLVTYAKARHITRRLQDVLHDWYDGSGVEIYNEVGLDDLLTTEIQNCLTELD